MKSRIEEYGVSKTSKQTNTDKRKKVCTSCWTNEHFTSVVFAFYSLCYWRQNWIEISFCRRMRLITTTSDFLFWYFVDKTKVSCAAIVLGNFRAVFWVVFHSQRPAGGLQKCSNESDGAQFATGIQTKCTRTKRKINAARRGNTR